MKIVYFIDRLSTPGGMEHLLTFKANYFAKEGCDVHIILLESKKNKSFFDIEKSIKLYYLDLESESSKTKGFISEIYGESYSKEHYQKVESILRRIKPDFAISLFNSERSFLHKINDGSKKIVEFHFSNKGLLKSTQAARFPRLTALYFQYIKFNYYKRIFKKFDAFIVTTNKDYEDWGELKNAHVIPNPYVSGIKKEKYPSYANKVVLSVGKTNYIKGYDMLIKAWKEIEPKYPDWKLRIIGRRKGEKDSLDSLIDAYKLRNVEILLPVKKIEEEFYKASIYVSTSRFEGFPLTLLHAQTCGLPIVAFDCPTGPKEIVVEKTGLIAKYLDIKDLSKKLITLMKSEKKRKLYGENAKEKVDLYSPDRVMDLWFNLFEGL